MKVKIYDTLTEHQQTIECRCKLHNEKGVTVPSTEEINAERKHFPLKTFVGTGIIQGYATEGDTDGVYPVAIVLRNGTFESRWLDDLETIDESI